MKVVWTAEAYECLGRIEDRATDPSRASKLVARIIEKVALLEDHPQLGRMVPEHERPDLRELIEAGQRIFYVVDADEIRVIAIFHGSALPPEVMLDPIDDE